MPLVDQWSEIRRDLPTGWTEARLSLLLQDPEDADRAALILGSLTPGRRGGTFTFDVRRGRDIGRVLARLDEERIAATLEASATGTAPETRGAPALRTPLAAQWDELIARLPPDWSDLYAQVELDSSDFVDRGALLLAPVNPARFGGRAAFRFRSARRAGYGVAAPMARRCLARLDAERITGTVRALRVLSSTNLASTQGPVWYVGGKSV